MISKLAVSSLNSFNSKLLNKSLKLGNVLLIILVVAIQLFAIGHRHHHSLQNSIEHFNNSNSLNSHNLLNPTKLFLSEKINDCEICQLAQINGIDPTFYKIIFLALALALILKFYFILSKKTATTKLFPARSPPYFI